ncbi:hypothetical protein B0H66DRAFT_538408 [Apodospora peruviana]|uniref:Uncharacterized protein n=1 Tax=Apodospora peruviana TaxID=516989 RepID=A0AAE0HSX8_9PEZI|nr:hypothetical protein B0H66DRAFT_538408 [Apodospora peruviana]
MLRHGLVWAAFVSLLALLTSASPTNANSNDPTSDFVLATTRQNEEQGDSTRCGGLLARNSRERFREMVVRKQETRHTTITKGFKRVGSFPEREPEEKDDKSCSVVVVKTKGTDSGARAKVVEKPGELRRRGDASGEEREIIFISHLVLIKTRMTNEVSFDIILGSSPDSYSTICHAQGTVEGWWRWIDLWEQCEGIHRRAYMYPFGLAIRFEVDGQETGGMEEDVTVDLKVVPLVAAADDDCYDAHASVNVHTSCDSMEDGRQDGRQVVCSQATAVDGDSSTAAVATSPVDTSGSCRFSPMLYELLRSNSRSLYQQGSTTSSLSHNHLPSSHLPSSSLPTFPSSNSYPETMVSFVRCTHSTLQVDVSSHAPKAGFIRPTPSKRMAAATLSGSVVPESGSDPSIEYTFPGPLVLPEDALAIDPEDPPQSLRSFSQAKTRNHLTRRRKTLYVGRVPTISPGVKFMNAWKTPECVSEPWPAKNTPPPTTQKGVDDIIHYLEAFYHPLPVKLLPGPVAFAPWDGETTASTTSRPKKRVKTTKADDPDRDPERYVGLQLGPNASTTRICTRPCPDGAFKRQLNLNDLTDAMIDALPADAYAFVLLIDQDMYEDEDDDFCCGRAFGGSRVAVVSSARYNPALDYEPYGENFVGVVEREHMWPMSHCQNFLDIRIHAHEKIIEEEEGAKKKKKKGKKGRTKVEFGPANRKIDGVMSAKVAATPLGAAVQAARKAPDVEKHITGQWFSRLTRTVAHELGHCFGIAHCVYYACVMQSTAGMAEDVRQPPYLCPVCLSKITKAIRDVERDVDEAEFQVNRYKALREFCSSRLEVGMFAGFHAWLGKRIEGMEEATRTDGMEE